MKNNRLYDEIHPVHRLAFVFDCRTYCQNCWDCLQFCFMHIIQQELDSIKREWNTHRIRVSKDRLVPAGIPEELFFLPQVHGITCDVNKFFLSQVITHAGTRDYISPTNYQDLQVARSSCIPVFSSGSSAAYAAAFPAEHIYTKQYVSTLNL